MEGRAPQSYPRASSSTRRYLTANSSVEPRCSFTAKVASRNEGNQISGPRSAERHDALTVVTKLAEPPRVEGRDPGRAPPAQQLGEIERAARRHAHAMPGEPGANRQMVFRIQPAHQRPAVARVAHGAGPAMLDRHALGDELLEARFDPALDVVGETVVESHFAVEVEVTPAAHDESQ